MTLAQNKEIDRLIHGTCLPHRRRKISAAVIRSANEYVQSSSYQGSVTPMTHLAASLNTVSEQLGDYDYLSAVLNTAAVAKPPLFMSALLHYTLCGGTLINAGNYDKDNKYLQGLSDGGSKGVYLITEIGSSGSHMNTRTRAVYEPTQRAFVITTPDSSGIKFSSVGSHGGPCVSIVFARLIHAGNDQGVYPFVVPLTGKKGPLPGVDVSQPLDISDLPLKYSLIKFSGVRVPYDNWLSSGASIDTECFHDPNSRKEERLTRGISAGGTIMYAMIPGAMAAISRVSSVLALRYSSQRISNGRLAPGSALITYRTQQSTLLASLAESLALTCVAREAHRLLGSRDDDKHRGTKSMTFAPWTSVNSHLALYKAISSEGAVRSVTASQRRCGVHGMLRTNKVSEYAGLARSFITAGGDNHLIFLDTGMSIAESDTPYSTHYDSDLDVMSPEWWPGVSLSYRGYLTKSLRDDINKSNANGIDLWNPLLGDAENLGRIHGLHLTARVLADTVKSIKDHDLRSVLNLLVSLYGVNQAKLLSGPLLSFGIITPKIDRSFTRVINNICVQLIQHLPLLYKMSGFPKDVIDSPLDASNYAASLSDALTWSTGGPA